MSRTESFAIQRKIAQIGAVVSRGTLQQGKLAMVKGFSAVCWTQFFTRSRTNITRGHSWILQKKHSQSDIFDSSLSPVYNVVHCGAQGQCRG